MKFNINLYNLMRSTRIIIDNRIQRFSHADNLDQNRSKTQKNLILSDFDLHYLVD